jgi:glycosyltransferase involved in cell wall biosynthesis
MNVLFISIAWPAKGNRNLYTDLMNEFTLRGHHVFVVGTKHIDKKTKTSLSEENGITVLRIYSDPIRKVSNYRKALSLLWLGRKIQKAIDHHLMDINVDLILSPTPPVTLSKLFKRVKKRYKASFYLLLKDIWPQSSVDLKLLRKYSLPWMFLRYHEAATYKVADYIGCMSPKGIEYILTHNRSVSTSKVEECPNCINPHAENGFPDNLEIRLKYGIPFDACIFLFSGNLSIGHGLGFLTETIKKLRDYPKAFFLIGGSGTQYDFLKEQLKGQSYSNTFLYSWLSEEDFNKIMEISDVGLILLHMYTEPQFPSRLLSYLDYSKPVLCAVNNYTDIGSIVENAGCGLSVSHGNMEDFTGAIRYFSENDEKRKEMGKNARKLLLEKYTVAKGYDIIMKHF